jgi:hypothetical protein
MVEGVPLRPVHSRRRFVTPALALLIIAAVCGVGVVRAQTGPTANVRSYGAVGNGTTNDTAAIQKANDAVAKVGGGTVYFPPGTYSAAGVKQDSNVEFLGDVGSTLRHRSGSGATPIVTGRLASTRGWISAGSSTMTVNSTYRMVPGAIVGIRAAAGPSEIQKTTLNGAVSAVGGLFMLRSPEGWRVNTRNYLLVENEIISYLGMSGNMLNGVQRALFGTKAANHPAGARVSQAQGLYAKIHSIVGKTVQLDRPAIKGVSNAHVWTGGVNMSLRGMTIDGKRPADPAPSNSLVSVRYDLARWVRVENNRFVKAAHGGITLDQGTSDSWIVNNVFMDNGNPRDGMGSGVWLYRGASNNTVSNNHLGGDSHFGIAVDDRTTVSTEWDASSDDNLIERNWIDIAPIDGQAASTSRGATGTRSSTTTSGRPSAGSR